MRRSTNSPSICCPAISRSLRASQRSVTISAALEQWGVEVKMLNSRVAIDSLASVSASVDLILIDAGVSQYHRLSIVSCSTSERLAHCAIWGHGAVNT